jgi:hypothetical protein
MTVGVSVGRAVGVAVGLGLTFEFGADGRGVTVGDRVGLAVAVGVGAGLAGAAVAAGLTLMSLPSEPARMLSTV